jgi:hypothetical protein
LPQRLSHPAGRLHRLDHPPERCLNGVEALLQFRLGRAVLEVHDALADGNTRGGGRAALFVLSAQALGHMRVRNRGRLRAGGEPPSV